MTCLTACASGLMDAAVDTCRGALCALHAPRGRHPPYGRDEAHDPQRTALDMLLLWDAQLLTALSNNHTPHHPQSGSEIVLVVGKGFHLSDQTGVPSSMQIKQKRQAKRFAGTEAFIVRAEQVTYYMPPPPPPQVLGPGRHRSRHFDHIGSPFNKSRPLPQSSTTAKYHQQLSAPPPNTDRTPSACVAKIARPHGNGWVRRLKPVRAPQISSNPRLFW